MTFDLKKFITEQKSGMYQKGRPPAKIKEVAWKVENAVSGVKHYLDILKREGKALRNREVDRAIHELDMVVAKAEDKVKVVLDVIDDDY